MTRTNVLVRRVDRQTAATDAEPHTIFELVEDVVGVEDGDPGRPERVTERGGAVTTPS